MHYKKFDEVKILVNHSTTIKENYEPVINCNKIVQSAKIIKIYNKKYLRAGDIPIFNSVLHTDLNLLILMIILFLEMEILKV